MIRLRSFYRLSRYMYPNRSRLFALRYAIKVYWKAAR